MTHRITISLALVIFAALFLVGAPATASASVTLNGYEKQILSLINAERSERGLAKVSVNATLTKAARAHSREMGDKQYFSHNSYNGESFSKRLIRFGYTYKGYRYWKVGETIYWGSGLYASPVNVVDQWMRSSTHRAVILTKVFRNVGIGAVKCEEGYKSCDEDAWFYTLDLGRRY